MRIPSFYLPIVKLTIIYYYYPDETHACCMCLDMFRSVMVKITTATAMMIAVMIVMKTIGTLDRIMILI